MAHEQAGGVSGRSRPASRWSGLDSADAVADALIGLYEERGDATYHEVVSQTDHAVQCGAHALASDAPDAMVAAAFLHDVGHLLDGRDGRPDEDHHHEDIAGRFLARWFDDDVTTPVRLHVAAKRYLCAVDPRYADELSAASTWTLELQGGPMSRAETAAFEAIPGSDRAVQLRRWDDLAKDSGAASPPLDTFRGCIASVVTRLT